jgi:hypothetical protein
MNMNTGSDSDSFDEGDLTARGRKAKGKGGSRANEKGKQKAKDVRPRAFRGTPIFFIDCTPCVRVYSKATPGKPLMLAPGIPFRRTKLVVSPVPSQNCLLVDDDAGAHFFLPFNIPA